jgi:iron(III) transport system substrate-binding protein
MKTVVFGTVEWSGRMRGFKFLAAAAVASLALAGAYAAPVAAEEVNLYSYRQPFLINPLLDAFTKESDIAVNVVYAKKGMLERLKAEGANSPADAVLTVDIGRLNDLVDADLVQAVRSPTLEAAIPAHLRHPDGLWFALTTRVRIVYASKERVKPGELARYEDLADPKWRGRICTRSGKHVYNVGLIASMIAHHGLDETETWLTAVKANLARKPQGNDRAQVRAIKEGFCDLAIGNHYYMAKMLRDPKQKSWADAVNIIFPNQADRGTHVNVSGVAVTKSAKNRDAAVRLVEFLAGPEAQRLYAAVNYEYPVLANVPLDPLVASFGAFKSDEADLDAIAKNRKAAIKLVDKVAFDL